MRIADDKRFPVLNALSYVAGHLVGMRSGAARVAELTERKSFIRPQALVASVVNDDNRNDLGDGVANWMRLAGHPPDLEDAYLVSTLFRDEMLVMPRHTLIRLIEQVGALHDAVLAHQLEPRTAEVGPEQLAPVPVNPPPHESDEDAVRARPWRTRSQRTKSQRTSTRKASPDERPRQRYATLPRG